MPRPNGYIKLHRQMLQWKWIKHAPTVCVFVHLLLNATYEKHVTWNGILLLPGQVLTSINNLVEETGLSTSQVRTAIQHLQQTGEITVDASQGRKSSIITIQNWTKYQYQHSEQQSDSQSYYSNEIVDNGEMTCSQNNDDSKVSDTLNINDDQSHISSQIYTQDFQHSELQSESQLDQHCESQINNQIDMASLMDMEGLCDSEPQSEQHSEQHIEQHENQHISSQISSQEKSQTKKKRNIKKDEEIKECVFLGDDITDVKITREELDKLEERFGKEFAWKCIEKLNNYKTSSKKEVKYKSDYRAILNWVVDEIEKRYPHLKKKEEQTNQSNEALNAWGGSL